jgi:dTDP-4-amino-4,6-dideoxygalactose transaminase
MNPERDIQFIDLKAQQAVIRPLLDQAVSRVLDHGHYIMGPEVKKFENDLKTFCGAPYALSCSDGTDALSLCLRAKNIGPGDAIFVPTFTFAATAEVVSWVGATPVFVDVLEDTYNLDTESLETAIQVAKNLGLKLKGITAVDLFGQPADYDAIQEIANHHGMWVMADAAQSFGAVYKNRKVGCLAEMTTTSFFPAKPLGCYGDGGAVFTNDHDLMEILQSLRIHGKGSDKYDNVRIGLNSRLDTIQAAILVEKLKIFSHEIAARNRVAKIYNEGLKNHVRTPYVPDDVTSVWAQYTVNLESKDRTAIMSRMKEVGVPNMIYYIKPLHLQTAYSHYPRATHLSVSERLAAQVLSLPMHPYLSEEDQEYIIGNFIKAMTA